MANKVIKLPPANGITGRYLTKQGHYDAYKIWRKSQGYKLWLKTQWRIQKGRCKYCKCSLIGRVHNVEHVIPQSAFGETRISNMVLSCAPCNKAKGRSKLSKDMVTSIKVFNHNKRQTRRRRRIRR